MARFLYVLTLICWALWLGGMVALLIFVTQLFATSRPVALQAAPVLFRTFAVYQLVVGAMACAAGTFLSVVTQRKCHAINGLVMVLALAAALVIRMLTVKMLVLLEAGQSSGPEFLALHIKSNIAYTVAAGLLALAGIGWALTSPMRRTSPGIGSATDSQALVAGRS
ncbi:MAG TPA: hypothetical protein VHD56_18560 [Tepidisphaeraceae bacterium]|nr:hypothetical protein [Tepidisphaeraceae bacterium]